MSHLSLEDFFKGPPARFNFGDGQGEVLLSVAHKNAIYIRYTGLLEDTRAIDALLAYQDELFLYKHLQTDILFRIADYSGMSKVGNEIRKKYAKGLGEVTKRNHVKMTYSFIIGAPLYLQAMMRFVQKIINMKMFFVSNIDEAIQIINKHEKHTKVEDVNSFSIWSDEINSLIEMLGSIGWTERVANGAKRFPEGHPFAGVESAFELIENDFSDLLNQLFKAKSELEDQKNKNEIISAYYNAVLTTVNDGVLIIDKGSQKVDFINPAASFLFDIAEEEVINKSILDTIYQSSLTSFVVPQSSETVKNIEFIYKSKSGQNLNLVKNVSVFLCNGEEKIIETVRLSRNE